MGIKVPGLQLQNLPMSSAPDQSRRADEGKPSENFSVAVSCPDRSRRFQAEACRQLLARRAFRTRPSAALNHDQGEIRRQGDRSATPTDGNAHSGLFSGIFVDLVIH